MAAKKDTHVVVGVHITHRVEHASEVQRLFTEYGKHIKTRLGLNDMLGGKPGPSGLILLEMVGGEKAADAMIAKLREIKGVGCKKMVFEHR